MKEWTEIKATEDYYLGLTSEESQGLAQIGHEMAMMEQVKQRTEERYRRSVVLIGTILIVWMLVCVNADWLVLGLMRVMLGPGIVELVRAHDVSVYSAGYILGLAVVSATRIYTLSQRCCEISQYFQIGRAKIPRQMLSVSVVLLILWGLTLMGIRTSWTGYNWRVAFLVLDMTSFMFIWFGYHLTMVSLDLVRISRGQIIREERAVVGLR